MKYSGKLLTALSIILFVTQSFALAGFTKTWGGTDYDFAGSIAVDGSNYVYIAGFFSGTANFNPSGASDLHISNGLRDAFLCKYDSNGALIWSRTWGGSDDDTGNGLTVDIAGNAYVVGRFRNTVDFNPTGTQRDWHTAPGVNLIDAFLCKFDSNGNFQWARTWGGTSGDEAYSVAVDGSGNAYVVGDFSSVSIDFNQAGPVHDIHNNFTTDGMFDAYLCKFDTNGNFQWAKTWGGIGYDDCCAVTVDGSGNVYGAGMFGSPVCDFDPGPAVSNLSAHTLGAPPYIIVDAFLCKFDSAGNFKWARSWGGTSSDVAEGVIADASGGIYISGYFGDTVDFNPLGTADPHISQGGSDAFFCKYDSNGNFQWAKTWGGIGNDYAERPAVDRAGNVYVPGRFSNTVDFNPWGTGDLHSSNGGLDIFVTHFDSNGNFKWTRTAGGGTDDSGFAAAADGLGNLYTVGSFTGTVDFGPILNSGTDLRTSLGNSDPFLCKIPTLNTLSDWRTFWFNPSELANPTISGNSATPAHDGVSNLIKYSLNLNPKIPATTGLPTEAVTTTGSGNYLKLTYTRMRFSTDITYIPEVSGDLQTWTSGLLITGTDNPDGLTRTIMAQDLIPMNTIPRRFIRLKVTQP